MADKLTPQQHEAVHNRGGKLLVSAAAGSGKTKVLVDRLLTYITDPNDPADLDEFLIITYTKAAATELRGKIAAKLTERIAEEPENRHLQKQMQRLFLTKISTVHGFCSDILREYAYRLDLPADFRVADDNETREIRETILSEMLDRIYEEIETNEDISDFVDTQGRGRDDRLVPEIIEKVYNSAKCHLDPEGWLEKCLSDSVIDNVDDVSETVWGKFLIEDLRDYLDCQILVFTQCAKQLDAGDRMEKPAQTIRDTLYQLENLRNAETWDQIVRNRNIDFGRLSFPRKDVDQDLIARVRAARNACKSGVERKLRHFTDDSRQALQDLKQAAEGTRGLIALVRQFDRDYSAAKRSRRVLDFSDLEHKTLDLLLGKSRMHPSAAAAEISKRYREILVDEYQDSNGVQDAIFTVLTDKEQNCFLVGDVKQSIYQFRLADPGIFLEKYHTFLPAETATAGQERKVLLSHNFRSGGEIIECVNEVFSTCMRPKVGGLYYTDAEALREGTPHEPLPDNGVELYALLTREETYAEEAAFVADRIAQMLHEKTPVRKNGGMLPVEPDDIVILLRSPGSAASYFHRALEAKGIRCTSGGGTDLLQTEEIATLRAFLQIIVNPRQDIPLIGTMASPIFGFTADELAVIRSGRKKGSFYDAVLQANGPKVHSFLQTLELLRKDARMNTLTGLLENCFQLTRLDSVYGSMGDGDTRLANLQMFYRLATDFEKGNLKDLMQFLDHLDALEERGLITATAAGSGCINIMSIHKSKGLEFPVVFLCNLSRKFNQKDLTAQVLCDKTLGIGLSAVDRGNRIRYPSVSKNAIATKMAAEIVSEEMRVLYVAMTRARDRLVMTYASRSLENDLSDAALRLNFDGGELVCREATCPGDWVLLEAVQHTEAGELHMLGTKPETTRTSRHPWKICFVETQPIVLTKNNLRNTVMKIPDGIQKVLTDSLNFRYPYLPATLAPSKQTATDRKGRVKDAEAAEHSSEQKKLAFTWRQPTFITQRLGGKEYGNAMHTAFQYLRYENCHDAAGVSEEIRRLVAEKFLTEEQKQLINCDAIAEFFETDIGKKLRSGAPCLREFKFSILDDAGKYGEDLSGEQVLLQGVVDCALLEPDGITIVDFKTDFVRKETLAAAVEKYRTQVKTYGDALSRIYELPVKAMYLYFFGLNQFVEIP